MVNYLNCFIHIIISTIYSNVYRYYLSNYYLPLFFSEMNGSQDTTQKRKTAERRTQRRGYFLPGDSMKSELEEVRDLGTTNS